MPDAEGRTVIRNLDADNHKLMGHIAYEHDLPVGEAYNRVIGDFLQRYIEGNVRLPNATKVDRAQWTDVVGPRNSWTR